MSATVQRIQLKRTKGWRMPENTVKVTRPGKWGNPFIVGQPDPHSGVKMTAEDAVARFEQYAGQRPVEKDIQRELHGKNLACWCQIGKPCHADVLLRIANE